MTRFGMALSAAMGMALAGCAADGSLQTASISKPETKVAAVDPACVAISNQIEILRKEGAIEGLEKAAAGKGASVKVKREALAKQAELNRTYADYQMKCGQKLPAGTQAAQVPAITPVAPVAQAATATVAAAAKKQ